MTSSLPTVAASDPARAALVDDRTQAFAGVDLDPTSSTFGGVRLGIPGVGLVWTAGDATLSDRTHDSAAFHYVGNGHVNPRARLDLEFGGVTSQLRGPVQPVSLRLDGAIDAGIGQVEVWVNGHHYSLVARAIPQDADSAAAAIVDALTRNDWAALYRLTDSDTHAALSEATFVAKMSAAGRVTQVRTTGPITYKKVTTGVSYASVPIFEQATVHGKASSGNATLVLVREHGEWHFFTTR